MFCPNCQHDLGSLIVDVARLMAPSPTAARPPARRARRLVSDETVVAMRKDFLKGELTKLQIAAKYGVNDITASALIIGDAKHRPDLPNPVRRMREEYARGGISIGQLAEKYGISPRVAAKRARA